MTDKKKLEEIEAYYKEVGNVVESEWIWLIETLKKYMDIVDIYHKGNAVIEEVCKSRLEE